MSRVRDKLKALYAPRPTELPEGVAVEPMAAPGEADPGPTEAPRQTPAQRAGRSQPPARHAEQSRTPAERAGRDQPPARRSRAETEPEPLSGDDGHRPDDREYRAPQRRPDHHAVLRDYGPPPEERWRSERPPRATDDTPVNEASLPPRFTKPPRAPAETDRPAAGSPSSHRNTFPRPGSKVVRSGDFERWRRTRRSGPALVESTDDRAALPDDDFTLERTSPGPRTAFDHLAAGKLAWSRGRSAEAAELLERALDMELEGREWWQAARTLVEAYIELGRDEDARVALEELVDVQSADPFPFLALADLIEQEEPERSEELRARARAIAPWV